MDLDYLIKRTEARIIELRESWEKRQKFKTYGMADYLLEHSIDVNKKLILALHNAKHRRPVRS